MSHPFENPLVRYAIGLSGAAIIAFIAIVFLEGTLQWIVLGIAVLDGVTVPKFLEMAVDAAESEEAEPEAATAKQ